MRSMDSSDTTPPYSALTFPISVTTCLSTLVSKAAGLMVSLDVKRSACIGDLVPNAATHRLGNAGDLADSPTTGIQR